MRVNGGRGQGKRIGRRRPELGEENSGWAGGRAGWWELEVEQKIGKHLRTARANISNASLMTDFGCWFRCLLHGENWMHLAEDDNDVEKYAEEVL